MSFVTESKEIDNASEKSEFLVFFTNHIFNELFEIVTIDLRICNLENQFKIWVSRNKLREKSHFHIQ